MCLHEGCIPAKELLETAEVLRTVQRAAEFGIGVGEPTLDLGRRRCASRRSSTRSPRASRDAVEARGVTIVTGAAARRRAHGALTPVRRDGHGGHAHGHQSLVIATGSEPRSMPGLEFDGVRILSSDHVLELAELPARVAIVGGGVIGCEFASMLVDMGSEVTMIEMLPRILAGTDVEVARTSSPVGSSKRGIKVHTDCARSPGIDGAQRAHGRRSRDRAGTTSVTVDQVIVSVGRGSADGEVGFDDIGLESTARSCGSTATCARTCRCVRSRRCRSTRRSSRTSGSPRRSSRSRRCSVRTSPRSSTTRCRGASTAIPRSRGRAHRGGGAGLRLRLVKSVHRFGGNSRALIIGETEGLVKIVVDGRRHAARRARRSGRGPPSCSARDTSR